MNKESRYRHDLANLCVKAVRAQYNLGFPCERLHFIDGHVVLLHVIPNCGRFAFPVRVISIPSDTQQRLCATDCSRHSIRIVLTRDFKTLNSDIQFLTHGEELLLSLVLCSFGVLVANTLDIRPISIEDVLRANPGLKAELRKKIEESKNEPTSVPATASAPATTTAATTTTTTTTPSPQADSPPSTTPESTTTRQPGRRRRPGAGARRRLRVSNNDAEEAPIQNGRTFPQ
ncbi:uncharacterized protein LOC125030846 isoform X1 [Penaeus chinensis]|uniref:uncharacterized protein LOC125030846 isoform X1 n=1 Tax=Penaeus chinensis TaxID=139456 RepID=UPI001FB80374|nr:uncharacterized protein LOC125030846 isoform X1 [Penaeus chinensis]